ADGNAERGDALPGKGLVLRIHQIDATAGSVDIDAPHACAAAERQPDAVIAAEVQQQVQRRGKDADAAVNSSRGLTQTGRSGRRTHGVDAEVLVAGFAFEAEPAKIMTDENVGFPTPLLRFDG